jgi:hypothetical protein
MDDKQMLDTRSAFARAGEIDTSPGRSTGEALYSKAHPHPAADESDQLITELLWCGMTLKLTVNLDKQGKPTYGRVEAQYSARDLEKVVLPLLDREGERLGNPETKGWVVKDKGGSKWMEMLLRLGQVSDEDSGPVFL